MGEDSLGVFIDARTGRCAGAANAQWSDMRCPRYLRHEPEAGSRRNNIITPPTVFGRCPEWLRGCFAAVEPCGPVLVFITKNKEIRVQHLGFCVVA